MMHSLTNVCIIQKDGTIDLSNIDNVEVILYMGPMGTFDVTVKYRWILKYVEKLKQSAASLNIHIDILDLIASGIFAEPAETLRKYDLKQFSGLKFIRDDDGYVKQILGTYKDNRYFIDLNDTTVMRKNIIYRLQHLRYLCQGNMIDIDTGESVDIYKISRHRTLNDYDIGYIIYTQYLASVNSIKSYTTVALDDMCAIRFHENNVFKGFIGVQNRKTGKTAYIGGLTMRWVLKMCSGLNYSNSTKEEDDLFNFYLRDIIKKIGLGDYVHLKEFYPKVVEMMVSEIR